MEAFECPFDHKYSKYCCLASSLWFVPHCVASVEKPLEYNKDFIKLQQVWGGTLLCNSVKVRSSESQSVLMVPQTVIRLMLCVLLYVTVLLW